MIRRLIALAVLFTASVLSTVVLAAAPAQAVPYPPSTGQAEISASAYDPCAGASSVIGGRGFQPGETVEIVLAGTGVIGHATVAADGTFQVTVTIPMAARGSDQVVATGGTSHRTAHLTLSIQCVVNQTGSGLGAGGGFLASTGAQVGGAVLVGLVLFGAGSALVVAGRRRRGHSTAR